MYGLSDAPPQPMNQERRMTLQTNMLEDNICCDVSSRDGGGHAHFDAWWDERHQKVRHDALSTHPTSPRTTGT